MRVLVPKLCLGTYTSRALLGKQTYLAMIVEAEPPGHAFPGRAREREIQTRAARFLVDLEFWDSFILPALISSFASELLTSQ